MHMYYVYNHTVVNYSPAVPLPFLACCGSAVAAAAAALLILVLLIC